MASFQARTTREAQGAGTGATTAGHVATAHHAAARVVGAGAAKGAFQGVGKGVGAGKGVNGLHSLLSAFTSLSGPVGRTSSKGLAEGPPRPHRLLTHPRRNPRPLAAVITPTKTGAGGALASPRQGMAEEAARQGVDPTLGRPTLKARTGARTEDRRSNQVGRRAVGRAAPLGARRREGEATNRTLMAALQVGPRAERAVAMAAAVPVGDART